MRGLFGHAIEGEGLSACAREHDLFEDRQQQLEKSEPYFPSCFFEGLFRLPSLFY